MPRPHSLRVRADGRWRASGLNGRSHWTGCRMQRAGGFGAFAPSTLNPAARTLGGLDDAIRTQAARADAQSTNTAIDHRPDPLQIRFEPTGSHVMCVADVATDHWSFSANFTALRHFSVLSCGPAPATRTFPFEARRRVSANLLSGPSVEEPRDCDKNAIIARPVILAFRILPLALCVTESPAPIRPLAARLPTAPTALTQDLP